MSVIHYIRKHPVVLALLLCLSVLTLSLFWPVSDATLLDHSVISLRITDREGGLLREIRPAGRGQPVSLAQVNPIAVEALIVTEDKRFFSHPGVDLLALFRAMRDNLRSGTVISGGSTLTMQAARAIRARTRRGWWDKIAEMHLALRLEIYFSKETILGLWLNRVSFGNQAFGIESASQLYFGKSARDLTLAEATYLIGLPQSPSRYNPFRHPARAESRQRYVLAAMQDAGLITAVNQQQIRAPELLAPDRSFRAPHFVQWTLNRLEKTTQNVTEIRTSIDPVLQENVEALARGHLRLLRGSDVTNAAAVVLDNDTGDILAYLGSVDFWDDRAGGQNDGVQMFRQPGSALKPFTYAYALSTRRYTPASILPDIELHVPEAGGAFSPQNYDNRYHGPVSIRTALASSYNVPAVYLAREIGPTALLATLHRAGFVSLTKSAETYGVGITLGNGEVQLLEMTRAFAGLARGGSLPPVRTEYWRRTTENDTLVIRQDLPAPTGLDVRAAYLITHILSDPEARSPAFGRGGPLELPFPCAVKTGTSKDYRDNWTVGYTPRHTVAVWTGNFDGAPMRWVSGVSGAGPLFKAIMTTLGTAGEFDRPDGIIQTTICRESGMLPNKYCPTRQIELFWEGTIPGDTCNVHRLVDIDHRTGMLAGASTPSNAVVPTLFTVYSPEYANWMREQGLPFPPQISYNDPTTISDSLYFTGQLSVQYPESGTVFRIDPVLRRDYQRLQLRGEAHESLIDVSWWIDNVQIAGEYSKTLWTLEPGRHRFELRAISREGRRLRSRPVEIIVVDAGG